MLSALQFEKIMSYRPNTGFPTNEPCLRDIIFTYYEKIGMTEERVDMLTKSYIEGLAVKFMQK